MTIAWFGWLATAVFATSYFAPKASTLMKIQAIAACLWIIYGLKMGALPVVVANLIVAAAALFSVLRNRACSSRQEAIPMSHSDGSEQS